MWARKPAGHPALIGRTEVLEEFRRLLLEATIGSGHGLVIAGERGTGKSELTRVLAELGARGGLRVLQARAHPEELPAPFSLIRSLLTSPTRDARTAAPEAHRELQTPIPLVPFVGSAGAAPPSSEEVSETRALLDGFDGILAPIVEQGVGGFEITREELLGRVSEYCLNLARQRPVLVVIDDLHLADTSSLELLWRLGLDLPTSRMLIVATTGVGEAVPESARQGLETLEKSPAYQTQTLRAFTLPEVNEFIREILGGRNPDPRDVLRWYTETEGNPLFIEQLVRSATGYRSRERDLAFVEGESLPQAISDRIQALGRNERRVLAHAAVLGQEFSFSDLQAVTELEEERVTESVDRLVQEGFLREKGAEVYSFVTETIRVGVYSDLTETHRRILHEKTGVVLEAKGRTGASELARHFFLGHDNERAVQYNLRAAQEATRDLAFETAASLLARALESERRRPSPDVLTEIRLMTEQGRLLAEAGSTTRSEELLVRAVALARSQPGREAELGHALLSLAWSRYERGEYASAETVAAEASNHLGTTATPRDWMAFHRVTGLSCWRTGNIEKASRHLRSALEIAEKEGTAFERGNAITDFANVIIAGDRQNLEPLLAQYATAAELFAKEENHVAKARVLMNRAWCQWEAGEAPAALEDLRSAIAEAERGHSARWIIWCQFNLAQILVEVGETGPAQVALDRAVRLLTPGVDQFAEQQVLMTRGMVQRAVGDLASAEASFQESLDLARHLNVPADISELLFRQAELANARGESERARSLLAEARSADLLGFHPNFAPRVAALDQALLPNPAPP